MKFITEDGEVFDTIEKAEAHEEDVKREKEKQCEFDAEREKRYDEVVEAFNTYKDLKDEFIRDFGSIERKSCNS